MYARTRTGARRNSEKGETSETFEGSQSVDAVQRVLERLAFENLDAKKRDTISSIMALKNTVSAGQAVQTAPRLGVSLLVFKSEARVCSVPDAALLGLDAARRSLVDADQEHTVSRMARCGLINLHFSLINQGFLCWAGLWRKV